MNIDEALPTFFAESAELLREMETDLLACTSAAPSADDVNRIFRSAHTLKGSAGLFGFDFIVEFVHEIEAFLDRVRLGKAVLDGTGFLKEVKKHPAYKFTPVIMLTTEAGEDKKQEGRAAGAKAWITKPFQPAVMLEAVSKLVMA